MWPVWMEKRDACTHGPAGADMWGRTRAWVVVQAEGPLSKLRCGQRLGGR